MEQDLTLSSQITHNRLSDYYVAIYFADKNKYNISIYSYVASRVGNQNHNNNKINMTMAKPSPPVR